MVQRTLGKTGEKLSPIAFGAFKIGRNQKIKYAQAYDLPSETEVERLLNGVVDLGINLIDTAPAYGISEERVGRHLAHRRKQVLLSTKVGETFENGQSVYEFGAAAVRRSVERSLQRLRTDVVDFVFIHSDGRDLHILNETDTVSALLDLKQRGLVRFIGLSGKTVEGARAAMAWADVLMVEYHAGDRSHEAAIGEAAAKEIGILIKKPLASGHHPPTVAIPFLLKNPAVHALVIGGLSLEHIRQNVAIAAAAQAC